MSLHAPGPLTEFLMNSGVLLLEEVGPSCCLLCEEPASMLFANYSWEGIAPVGPMKKSGQEELETNHNSI